MCVNYIGFLCLIATYEVGTETCRLVDTETGIWQRERGLLTRQRQRRVVDPSSYCVQDRTGTGLNYQQAIAKCAELGPGWSIPVIRDATMNAKLSDYYGWISAKSTIAGVYKTHEDEYIPYSRWLSNEPDSFWGGCSSLSLDGWKSVYCNMPLYRTKCLAYLDDICRHHLNITHGHVVQNSTTRSVLYICDDGYFMPTLKATSFYVNCDCDWLTSLERVENCTDIECPPPADFGNRTLMTFSGLRINDTALYQCPYGYQVSETGLVYYNVTCRLERSTVNGTWSDHPDIEALNCNASKPMLVNAFAIINDVSIGSMMHIVCEEGYRIYNSTTNTINTTCEVDELGLTANWCWVPKCEAIRCPQPASVHMASYVVLGNKTNDNTTYTCPSNYRIKDSSRHEANATCGYDENYQGIWLGVPTCELITCSAPPMLKNAFLDVTPNTTEIGAIATYQCNESFTLFRNQSQVNHTNKFNATCLANYALHGIWSFDYTCETPLCYEPPVVENSSLEMSTTTLNSSVNYTCSVGYIFPSTGKRTATSQCVLELGQLLPHWTPVGNCTPITCGEAPNISHASVVSLSSRDIGSAAEYSCDLGFAVRKAGSFESNFQLTCSLNESLISAYWSDPPTCEAMICSAPPTIANGKVEVQGHGIGDRAIYTCDDHYKISSSASSFGVSRFQESVCVLDAYGGVIWQPIPTCIEESTKQTVAPLIRQCSAPPNIRGTALHYKHTFINSVSVYVAQPGFAFECQGRTRSLICQTNGRWGIGVASSKLQLCQRIHVPGATLSTEETAVGTEVTVTCINRNARMENGLSTMKIKCAVGGKWTYVPRNCQVNRCGPFDIVEHSGIVAFNNSVGGLVVVKCDKSSSFPQGLRDNSFRCLPDLTWERHGFCIVNACRALAVPRYGTLSTYIAVQGTVVDVKCLPGYMFPDRSRVKHVTCNSTLNWNATIPDCELLTCPNPPNVTNASTTKIDTQYNSNITYTCEIPYRMETGHTELTIRCTESGQWTPTSVSCDFGRCPPVPEVENAEPDRRLATNGSVVVYTCLDGYAMANGDRQMTISCDGTSWNFTETTSIKSKCPELNLTHVSWIQGGNGYGEETRFVCDDGYQYDGSTGGVLRCQANSHWSEDITGCLPVDCGSPPEMKNSVRSIVPENVLGTIVTYECLPNYRIQPGVTNVSVTCTKSGEWTNLTSQCTIIKCPAVPVWIDGMSTNSTNNQIGTVLNISCWTDEGTRKTILLTRCTSDGEWLPSLDRCGTKKKVVRFEPEPEEARASQGIGVVILACIMIFFLLITISDVPAIVNGLKGNKKMIRVRKRRHQRD